MVRRWSRDTDPSGELRIDGVNEVGLEAVVGFMYSGVIDEVSGETCAAMLHASQQLQVDAWRAEVQAVDLAAFTDAPLAAAPNPGSYV